MVPVRAFQGRLDYPRRGGAVLLQVEWRDVGVFLCRLWVLSGGIGRGGCGR